MHNFVACRGVEPLFPAWKAGELADIRTGQFNCFQKIVCEFYDFLSSEELIYLVFEHQIKKLQLYSCEYLKGVSDNPLYLIFAFSKDCNHFLYLWSQQDLNLRPSPYEGAAKLTNWAMGPIPETIEQSSLFEGFLLRLHNNLRIATTRTVPYLLLFIR